VVANVRDRWQWLKKQLTFIIWKCPKPRNVKRWRIKSSSF
jgi:hypothetical protein